MTRIAVLCLLLSSCAHETVLNQSVLVPVDYCLKGGEGWHVGAKEIGCK